MSFFGPDSFFDQPYVAGVSALGHWVLGAAILATLQAILPLWEAAIVTGLGVSLWELRQLVRKGGKSGDFVIDMSFWHSGILSWCFAIDSGLVTGPAVFLLLPPILCAGLLMAMLHHLQTIDKGD